MAEQMGLTSVLDHLDDEAEDGRIEVGDVVESFGGRGYGPILLGLALIEILPTGAIPGVPTLVAIMVILIASQMIAGKNYPWVPKKLAGKGFKQEKFEKAREKIRPVTRRFDLVLKPRLKVFTGDSAARIVGVVCIALAALMPPLELIPFASSVPSSAIAIFGLGLSSKDGLVVLIGFALSIASAIAGYNWLV